MSDSFVGELIVGLILIVVASICIFGRNVLIADNIKWTEQMLAQLQKNSMPQRLGVWLFGAVFLLIALDIGLFDNAYTLRVRLWSALVIGLLATVCFISGWYIVPMQTFNLRLLRDPRMRQIGTYFLVLLGGICGGAGLLLLRDSFLMFFKR